MTGDGYLSAMYQSGGYAVSTATGVRGMYESFTDEHTLTLEAYNRDGFERAGAFSMSFGQLTGSTAGGQALGRVGVNALRTAPRNVAGQFNYAYHYTSSQWAESIQRTGLRPGSYATPSGNLTGLQAQLELSLNPTRAAPNMRVRINLDAMRRTGYDIPMPRRVSNVVTDPVTGRGYTMPGGGYEMQFPYKIPSKYLEVPGQ